MPKAMPTPVPRWAFDFLSTRFQVVQVEDFLRTCFRPAIKVAIDLNVPLTGEILLMVQKSGEKTTERM